MGNAFDDRRHHPLEARSFSRSLARRCAMSS
jgi:hypothetical protein